MARSGKRTVAVAGDGRNSAMARHPSDDEIRRRAFELFLARGAAEGCALENRFQAERELRERRQASRSMEGAQADAMHGVPGGAYGPEGRTRGLLWAGALWNSFVAVGSAATLCSMAFAHLPDHAAPLDTSVGEVGGEEEADGLDAIYADMKPANFSRDVPEKEERLSVIAVEGSGWCDWGSPARVLAAGPALRAQVHGFALETCGWLPSLPTRGADGS